MLLAYDYLFWFGKTIALDLQPYWERFLSQVFSCEFYKICLSNFHAEHFQVIFLYFVQYISFYSDFYNILLKVSSLKTYENTASDVLYFWHYYKLYLVGIRRFFCQMSYFGSVWTIAAFNSSMPVYTTIVRKLFFFFIEKQSLASRFLSCTPSFLIIE